MASVKLQQKQPMNINFLESAHLRLAVIISSVLMLVATASIVMQGLNFGLDFTGGNLVEVRYKESVQIDFVRQQLEEGGHTDAIVQHFGTNRDVSIRLGVTSSKIDSDGETLSGDKLSDDILKELAMADSTPDAPNPELLRAEYVGPAVGEELVEDGGLAVVYTLIGILIYVSFRFQWRFAVGAVLALIHDSLITIGFFSVLQLEFNLTVLAAVLAVIGYSLNDTIVVFDRIRDNFLKMRKAVPREVMNTSINQILIRTLMTSITTLLVLIALAVLGGELIRGFAIALIVGVIVGTYSSIYVASAAALVLGVSKADLMPVQKEGEEFTDERP